MSVRPFQPDVLGEWVENITPDFAGRGQGGRWMVVLSAQGPTGDFFWALGHSSSSLAEARDVAIAEMMRRWFDQDVGILLASGLNYAE